MPLVGGGPFAILGRPGNAARVMPVAELDVCVARQPFGFRGWTGCRRTMSRQRADRLLFEVVGTIDDRLIVAAGAAHRGEHDGVKNRTGAGDAAGVAQRGALEVADPDSDGDGARVADGPVVVVGLRGAG